MQGVAQHVGNMILPLVLYCWALAHTHAAYMHIRGLGVRVDDYH